MTIEMIGPFDENPYVVSVDGYRVPWLSARPTNPQETEWTVLLDKRLAIDLPADIMGPVVEFLAEALAVGFGYKSFADACNHQGERHNPFGTRLIHIEYIENGDNDASQTR